MNNYFELKISINPNIEDIVSDICFSNFPSCEGVILAEEAWKDLEMTATTRGTLKVFLTTPHPVSDHLLPQGAKGEYLLEIQSVLHKEREILKSRGFSDEDLGSWEISIDEKENQDWSKKWKEKWTVTHVTERIAVVPSWLDYQPKENEVIITLDPGCAFGTGTHQTTQLCMKAIEKYLEEGNSMADIGTGSGILAICAKKFGANEVYGCDNDETVIDVCIENAGVNGVNDIKFELNTADKLSEKYNFVCANILHNVLAEIMGDLKNIMKPQAKLVLSGILDEKKPVVLDAIDKHGLKIIDTLHQDQWVAFVVEN